MSIISTAEFLVAFYEKLPEYLMAQSATKANIKDYKRLKSFMQKIKNRLSALKDDVSLHAAHEQKKFVDATLALATEFLRAKKETEETSYQKEVIEYTLYVWSLYASLPKTIQKFALDGERAKASDYYEVYGLSEEVISTPLNFAFYQTMFFEPFEKIRRASAVFQEKYIHLASPSAQEGMAFTSTVAEEMKKMCRDFTLIYAFADRVRQTSRHTFVLFMNAMPSVVFELLESPMTKKGAKELRSFIKHLEKQCKKFGWNELLNDELLLTMQIATATSVPTGDVPVEDTVAETVDGATEETVVETADGATEETVAETVDTTAQTETENTPVDENEASMVEDVTAGEEATLTQEAGAVQDETAVSAPVETQNEEDFQVEITETPECAEETQTPEEDATSVAE